MNMFNFQVYKHLRNKMLTILALTALMLSTVPIVVSTAEAATSVQFKVEALPNPVGDDVLGEYIILSNLSSQPVELIGWKLIDHNGDETDLDSIGTIGSNSTRTICINTNFATNGGVNCHLEFGSNFNLVNSNGEVVLVSPMGEEIVVVEWGSTVEGSFETKTGTLDGILEKYNHGDLIDLCHYKDSDDGTYDALSVTLKTFFGSSGHDDDSDDIIPPFFYDRSDGVMFFPGSNWDKEGKKIWAHYCVEPGVDVCPNIGGDQAQVPEGYELNEAGNCVEIAVDICPNIDGNQTEVPNGYEINQAGDCVPIPVDMCPNLDGVQTVIPDGYQINDTGDCIEIPVDVCPNLDGIQSVVPAGYELNDSNDCVPLDADYCPNLDGVQTEVPVGYEVNNSGDCVDTSSVVDVCPNIGGDQAVVPDGYEINQAGDCVPVQVIDVCPNIGGNQSEVPEGYEINESGNCVETSVDVDVCLNLEGVQSVVPEGYELDEGNNCVPLDADFCPNFDGVQTEVPVGYEVNDSGDCVDTSSVVDVCPNLDGVQSEIPNGFELDEQENCIESDGGGSGETDTNKRRSVSTGTRVNRDQSQPQPQVLGASTSQCPFIIDYMQIGVENDPWEVTKLQMFLSIVGGYENPVTGVFDRTTDVNVKLFQDLYYDEVLAPWYLQGIVPHDEPTGFVYKTTRWKINDIVCPDQEDFPSLEGEDLTTNVDID